MMPEHGPSLDNDTLAALRRYVADMRHRTTGVLPMEQLVGLGCDVRTPEGVTIDFSASEQLGAPLVVLRVRERAGADADLAIPGLSRRELQVCALIAEGRSNKQIASRLSIALATVKDHVHKILRKTGAPNRAAIAVAYRDFVTAARGGGA
jgi:DNA-binding CsgD family transcriptional regulator